jgi:exosortase
MEIRPDQSFNRARWACFALTAALLAALFLPALRFTIAMFEDPYENMGHGWLIPVVSAYAIWRVRASLRLAAGAPDWRGAAALLGCLLLFWFGSRGEQARLMQFGMVACVTALPVLFWGRGVARLLLFPTAYLLFIVPVSFLDALTFHLRLVASSVSCVVLNGIGIAVQQVGTSLHSADAAGFKLDVADPCSGMRSLFALAALMAAYAWLTQKTALRRWLLFLAAVPVAVIGNIVRILTICLVAQLFGQERAVGFYHDYSGYVVFVVAVLLMLQLAVWIQRIGREPEPAAAVAAVPLVAPAAAAWRRFLPCLAAPALAGLGLAVATLTPRPEQESDRFLARELPMQAGAFAGQVPWFCQNDQCLATFLEGEVPAATNATERTCPRCGHPLERESLGERTKLPGDTRIIKRVYGTGDGRTFTATLVVSGASRLSIHRPEICLPGQGFSILSSRMRTVTLGHGRALRVNVVRAARSGEHPIGFLYWFVNPRGETPSHWTRIFSDVWARTVHNRVNRWCMVQIFSTQPFDDEEVWQSAGRFLSDWYPQAVHLGAPGP